MESLEFHVITFKRIKNNRVLLINLVLRFHFITIISTIYCQRGKKNSEFIAHKAVKAIVLSNKLD